MMNHCMLTLFAGAFLITANAVGQEGAKNSEDPQIQAAKEKYGFAEWGRGPMRPGLDLSRLSFTGYEGERELAPGPFDTVRRRFEGLAGRSSMHVELLVADSVRAAHERLAGVVAFVSSTKTLPTLAEEAIAAGDHGYVGYSGAAAGRISWIAFVQGNLCVRVHCHDPRMSPHEDLGLIAQEISQAIAKVRPLARGVDVPRPEILRVTASVEQCDEGDDVALEVELRDSLDRTAQVFWNVRGTAQGYVEEEGPTLATLTATKAGTMTVEVTVVGSNGTVARSSVSLEVAPD